MLFAWLLPSSAHADLDLDQQVRVIPDTHDVKPYIWQVRQEPQGYELVIGHTKSAGKPDGFLVGIKTSSGELPERMHVFVTDEDLHVYSHVRPMRDEDGHYLFNFIPPSAGNYRFEIVFRTEKGWINLRKDISLEKSDLKATDTRPGEEDYDVKVNLYPKKIYADHVVTFLYQIRYKDTPLIDLEKIEEADMQVAAWDENMKEFIYMTPQQNLGGPDVAVSMVFRRPGKHAVFAEFKHNGIIRRVDFVVNVYAEPPLLQETLPGLGPSG